MAKKMKHRFVVEIALDHPVIEAVARNYLAIGLQEADIQLALDNYFLTTVPRITALRVKSLTRIIAALEGN